MEDIYKESLRKIVKGAGLSFIGTIIGIIFGYLSRLVIARFLDPHGYGLISLGYAVFTIAVTLSLLGIPQGVIRYVAFYKGRGGSGKVKGTIFSALKITIPSSIIATLVLFFGAEWISVIFFHEPNLAPVLQIFAFSIPFWVIAQIAIAATIGFQDLRYDLYVTYIFQNSFRLVAIVVLLSFGYGVLGASIGWVLAIVGMPFLAFYFLDRKVFSIFNTSVKADYMQKEILLFSYPLIFAGITGLIMGWTDTITLGYFLGAGAVGVYNAALPTANLIRMPLSAFGIIFSPIASELYASNRYEDLRRIYSIVTKWVLLITLPAFLLLVPFSESMIVILFGYKYAEGSLALCILTFGFFIISLIGPASSVIHAFGETKVIMKYTLFGAILNVTLNLALIPLYGVSGAAIATVVSLMITHFGIFISAHKISGIQPFRAILLKPTFASIIALVISCGITKFFGHVPSTLVARFLAFLTIYFLLVLLFKSFEDEDLMIMKTIDERLGMKKVDLIRKVVKKFL